MQGRFVKQYAWLLLAGLSLAGQQAASQEAPSAGVAPPAPDYSRALQPWVGDYEGMVERRMVRIAVPYSMTHYLLDGATERGISAARGRQLEAAINRKENLRTRLVQRAARANAYGGSQLVPVETPGGKLRRLRHGPDVGLVPRDPDVDSHRAKISAAFDFRLHHDLEMIGDPAVRLLVCHANARDTHAWRSA